MVQVRIGNFLFSFFSPKFVCPTPRSRQPARLLAHPYAQKSKHLCHRKLLTNTAVHTRHQTTTTTTRATLIAIPMPHCHATQGVARTLHFLLGFEYMSPFFPAQFFIAYPTLSMPSFQMPPLRTSLHIHTKAMHMHDTVEVGVFVGV